ncbi:hypothetical protein MPTK2_4g04650 [Marchantia polymorpha subsp. ruderalis]
MDVAVDESPPTGLGLRRQQLRQTGPCEIFEQVKEQMKGPPLRSVMIKVAFPFALLNIGASVLLTSRIPNEPSWQVLMAATALGLATSCLGLLVVAATFFTVGRQYRGEKVTLQEALRAMLGLWPKLFVTHLYNAGFMFAIATVTVAASISVIINASSDAVKYFAFVVIALFFIILAVVLQTLLLFATAVTCYEKTYGWAAYKQAQKLLQRKWNSVPLFALIFYVLPVICATITSYKLKAVPKTSLWMELLRIISYAFLNTWFDQQLLVSGALFYFSCSEKSDEQNVSDSMEAGYHSIPSQEV